MGKYLDQLRSENTPISKVSKVSKGAYEPFDTPYPGEFSERKAIQGLAHRIQQAVTEAQMEQIAADIDVAYHRGDLGQGTAEELAEQLLRQSRNGTQQQLDELFAVQSVVRVESRVLGEVVMWVRDETAIPPGAPEVAYTHSELKRLSGMAPEVLRAVHAAKKGLDGELIEAADTGKKAWAHTLVDGEAEGAGDACPCCGKAPWWDNAGRRTCGVCHPNPRRAREALKTEPTTKEAVPHVA